MSSDGPQSQTLPDAVVVKFSHLEPDMPDFIENYPRSVDIPTITAEWENLVTIRSLYVNSSI